MPGNSLKDYLASLPNSWSSHPANQAHRDVLLPYLNEFPSLALDPDCPNSLRTLYEQHQQGNLSKYVQEVHLVALLCLIRDRMVESDERFVFLVGRLTAQYVKTGLFKQFLKHIPVKMMVITASSVWERAHLNTQFRRQSTHPTGFEAMLHFPESLYPSFVIKALTRGMQVMLSFSGLRAPHAFLKAYTKTQAHIIFSWGDKLDGSAESVRG